MPIGLDARRRSKGHHRLHGTAIMNRVLLNELTQQSPTWLRRQLTEPDPVWLHDWNVSRDVYERAVRYALTVQGMSE